MSNRRIVIVGFMGSGKTTVAEAVAHRLDCHTIDLDSFITEREGRSPAEIIEQDGEPAFREIETRALHDVLEKDEARVIALGGGTWTIQANRALVAQNNCLSIWLDAPFELCWQRITAGGNKNKARPLAPNRESALRLYESRRASYGLANKRIPVNSADTIETVVEEILTQS